MFEAVELGLKVSKEEYDKKVPDLRIKLLQAQEQLKDRKFPVLILIHGADGAGKGEVLNTLHEWLDPRFLQTTAFGPRSDEERARPEYWRYWLAMPPKGRTGLYFCSWYTRPILQRAYDEIKQEGPGPGGGAHPPAGEGAHRRRRPAHQVLVPPVQEGPEEAPEGAGGRPRHRLARDEDGLEALQTLRPLPRHRRGGPAGDPHRRRPVDHRGGQGPRGTRR